MAQPVHKVWLCDKNWARITQLNFYNLQYRRMINGVGQAYFEMQIQDPVFSQNNFVFETNVYNIEIERAGVVVFRGEWDEINIADTKSAVAMGVMDRLGCYVSHQIQSFNNLIANSDSGDQFFKRSFNNITIGAAVTALVNEAIGKTNSPVATVSIGTVEDPLDDAGKAINVTPTQALYGETILNWIDMLSLMGNADYYMGDTDNKFYFVKHKGVDSSYVFRLHQGESGNNLADIQIDTSKLDMHNRVIVAGAGTIQESSDAASQALIGLREIIIPARPTDDATTAKLYADKQLAIFKSPNNNLALSPSGNHEPLVGFSIGDTVTVDIDWYIFTIVKKVRVVGLETYVSDDGSEEFVYLTIEPS